MLIKDPVVHVRVQWIMEACTKSVRSLQTIERRRRRSVIVIESYQEDVTPSQSILCNRATLGATRWFWCMSKRDLILLPDNTASAHVL